MRITVASGKGGTGKTTVAVALALSLARTMPSGTVLFLDADVEAPNAHLFLHPVWERREEFAQPVPEVDLEKCTGCGRCAEVCAYHAIAVFTSSGQQPVVLVFPELCHGCGGCQRVCPAGAIREVPQRTGVIEEGVAGPIRFARGVLDVGKAMASPLIRNLKDRARGHQGAVILDAPPGTGCPVVHAMHGADYVLLVTEPTPFGEHDLRLAAGVARELGIPAGVVINRDGIGDSRVEAFCAENGLPVLMRIPFDRGIAAAYAEGVALPIAFPEYRERFAALYEAIRKVCDG